MQDHQQPIVLFENKKEAFEIFNMGWLGRSALVTILTASFIVTTFVHGNFMRYILFYAPKKRPINILIMIDQVKVF